MSLVISHPTSPIAASANSFPPSPPSPMNGHEAVLSLLSLGAAASGASIGVNVAAESSLAVPVTPLRSPMKTPSPQSVAALEKRMRGQFQFASATKENHKPNHPGDASSHLPPKKESSYKTNMSAHKRASLLRTSTNANPPQAPNSNIALPPSGPDSHTARNRALPSSSHSSSTTAKSPRRIVPTYIRDDSLSSTDPLPTPHELTLELNRAAAAQKQAHVCLALSSESSSLSPTKAQTSDSNLLRTVSAPSTAASSSSQSTSSSSPSILAEAFLKYASKPPSSQNAYIHQLLRARSTPSGTTDNSNTSTTGTSGLLPSAFSGLSSKMLATPNSMSSASLAASLVASATRPRPSSSFTAVRSSSGSYHCATSRVRVCIKPIDQIKIKASTLLDEARSNKKNIRTYEFP